MEFLSGLWEQTAQNLMNNQFFQGGAVLGALGAIVVYLRRVPEMIYNLFIRYAFMNIEVYNNDNLYFWIVEWLSKNQENKKTTILRASTNSSHVYKNNETRADRIENDRTIKKEKPKVFLSHGFGNHLIWYNKIPIFMSRVKTEKNTMIEELMNEETYVFRTLRWWRKDLLKFLKEVRDTFVKTHEGKTIIYKQQWGEWRISDFRPIRPLDSVILGGDIKKQIVSNFSEFLHKKGSGWYKDKHILAKRCYQLRGPTGSGKTSLIAALAGHFGYDVCIMNLKDISDDSFGAYLSEAPKDCFVVLEDYDSFVNQRETTEDTKLTFSGFINNLDGILSREGMVIFLTTNNPDCDDAAAIRRGRVDRSFEIGYADQDQIRRLFLRFYPGKEEEAKQFAGHFDFAVCPANLQGYFDDRSDSYELALKEVECLKQSEKLFLSSLQKNFSRSSKRTSKRGRKPKKEYAVSPVK